MEIDIYSFSKANKEEVLEVYDLEELKREFRDENEKLAEVY